MYRRILIAVDETDSASRAVREGVALARMLSAAARFVHVGRDEEMAAMALQRAQAVAGEARVPFDCATVTTDDLPGGILTQVEAWGPDLIVVGSHSRGGVARMLLGSVSQAVVSRAPVPVLVVREAAAAPLAVPVREARVG